MVETTIQAVDTLIEHQWDIEWESFVPGCEHAPPGLPDRLKELHERCQNRPVLCVLTLNGEIFADQEKMDWIERSPAKVSLTSKWNAREAPHSKWFSSTTDLRAHLSSIGAKDSFVLLVDVSTAGHPHPIKVKPYILGQLTKDDSWPRGQGFYLNLARKQRSFLESPSAGTRESKLAVGSLTLE